MYISNKTNTNRFSSAFTPSLNNVRGQNGPSKSRLGTPTPKFQAPTGANNLSYSQPTNVSPAMQSFGKTQSISGLIGPKQPPVVSSRNTTPSPAPAGANSSPIGGSPSVAVPTPTVATSGTGFVAPVVGNKIANNSSNRIQANQTGFSGLVSAIENRSKVSNEQQRLQRQLEQEAQANKAIGENARQLSEQYGKEIATVGKLGAGAVAGDLSTGSSIVGSGNANLASQAASSRMQALGNAQQAALQGTGQQLTSQSQTQSGLNQALGSANTQQQTGLSGLGTAAGFAAPNPAAYGQTVFDPLTGQYSGGNLDPQTQATNLAQQVMSGRMTYEQAMASLGYAGSAGTNFLNNAITSAGGNPLQLQATGNAQQANIGTAGTAATDIARAGLGAVTPQYVQTEANVQAASQQAGRALEILQQTGLNNISSTDYNKAANELRSRMGDPNFAAFQTAINEAKNFYTSVLAGSGSTPSGNEEIAGNIAALNTNSPISAIVASLDELKFASATRLQSLNSQRSQYNQNIGGGGSTGGGGGFAEAW